MGKEAQEYVNVMKTIKQNAEEYEKNRNYYQDRMMKFTKDIPEIDLNLSEEDRKKELSYSLKYAQNIPEEQKITKEANAIVLGAMLDKKLLEGRKTSSSVEKSFGALEFNQNFMIENVIAKGEAEERISDFRTAVVEARESAKRAIADCIQKNDAAEAKKMLHNLIDVIQKNTLDREIQAFEGQSAWAAAKLAVDVLDKPPLREDGGLTEVQKINLKSYVRGNEMIRESMQARLALGDAFPAPGTEQRKKLLETLLVAEVLTSQMNRQMEEIKEKHMSVFNEKIQQMGLEEKDGYRINSGYWNSMLKSERNNYATQLQVMLSTEEGALKAYQAYLAEIEKTEEYQQLLNAEEKEFEELLEQSKETLQQSLKVNLPEKTVENENGQMQMKEAEEKADAELRKVVEPIVEKKHYFRNNSILFSQMKKKLKKETSALRGSSESYKTMQKSLEELEAVTEREADEDLDMMTDKGKEDYQKKVEETIQAVTAYLEHKGYLKEPAYQPKNEYERRRRDAAREVLEGLKTRLKLFEKQHGLKSAEEKITQEQEVRKQAQERKKKIQQFLGKISNWNADILKEKQPDMEKALASAVLWGLRFHHAVECLNADSKNYRKDVFEMTHEDFLDEVKKIQESKEFQEYYQSMDKKRLYQELTSQKALESHYEQYRSHLVQKKKNQTERQIENQLEKQLETHPELEAVKIEPLSV